MGLLQDMGEILSPEEARKLQGKLKQIGIQQFLRIYEKYHLWEKTTDPKIIKWGEEIEGNFLEFDEKHELKLSLQKLSEEYDNPPFHLIPEYGAWMFELIPFTPYQTHSNFEEVIHSIRARYDFLHSKSKIALTIPVIPFLGVHTKEENFENQITQSLYISDNHIHEHIRFRTLTKNIRLRRGRTVEMHVPLLIDKNTNLQEIAKTQVNPNFIYLDAMAFGMGMSCLQCTFSTKNLYHARYLYDQMHVLSPILLAMTAGTPFYKGKMANWDARWNVVAGSVDDRNQEERNPHSQKYLPNARYSQANLYLWEGPLNKPQYNDLELNINPETKKYMQDTAEQFGLKIDDYLINHVANLFKRDILIVHEKFKEMTDQQNTLFEMLNGTNWNSVRLKIPPNEEIGWRIQFRTMEIQLMPDENAAYSLFMHLFVRVLHQTMDLNLYIPISLVKENFDRGHEMNALRKNKFFFRTNIFENEDPKIEELSIDQIMFGKGDFVGIFNYVEEKMKEQLKGCQEGRKIVRSIGKYFKDMVSGSRVTLAQWIRKYIDEHPDYKHDSLLSKRTMDDVVIALDEICKGKREDPNFKPIFDLNPE